MSRILILYSSVDGQTRRIGERLQELMTRQGQATVLTALAQADGQELPSFDKLVIGASIRYGRHRPEVAQFIERHRTLLARKPSVFFSVNIVARKPEKGRPDNNPYLQRFLRQTTWQPRLTAVFAGRLDYPRYRFLDRHVIRLIMLLTHGPTDVKAVTEFTDWQQVDAFGRQVCALP